MFTIIRCTTYTHVSEMLLSIKLSDLKYAHQTSSNPPFLILSDTPFKPNQLSTPLQEFIPVSFCKRKKIRKGQTCRSIKKDQLDMSPFPYLHLYHILSQLRYEYSKAKLITDPYGIQYLVVF